MDWISSHRAEPQPQRVVASKTKTHISENKSMLPSVRPRGACLQNSFFLRCFNIYIYVYILCKDLSLINNAFVYIYVLYSKEYEYNNVTIEKTFQKLPSRLLQRATTPHITIKREFKHYSRF